MEFATLIIIGIVWASIDAFRNTWRGTKKRVTARRKGPRVTAWVASNKHRSTFLWDIASLLGRILHLVTTSVFLGVVDFADGARTGWKLREQKAQTFQFKRSAHRVDNKWHEDHQSISDLIPPLKEVPQVATTEAASYESAIAALEGLKKFAAEFCNDIDTTANSLRSFGVGGYTTECLASAYEMAAAAASSLGDANARFASDHGAVAEAIAAAGGGDATADTTAFYGAA